MAVAIVAMASCSEKEMFEPDAQGTTAWRVVVGDFPAFDGNPQTRASNIGTPDAGKTQWAENDEIIITVKSEKYGTQYTTLTYDGEEWCFDDYLKYLEGENEEDGTLEVTALYAPCYEVLDDAISLKEGMIQGMDEYLEVKCHIENRGVLQIPFSQADRNYSRLRIAAMPEATLTVTTTGFTPAGATAEATEAYTLTADDKGNAYLYGTFAEEATVSVKQGEVTLKDYTFTAEKNPNGTEYNKSYALDARPVIDLSQYSEGETVEIIGNGRIIGDGNEYNLTLNVADDATIVFEVGTSGVKLDGEITVADGKTLTLRIEGDAEHTINGGISLGNSSNVIIEGDLTKENNKLTVTATDGNAGIGANNGVTAGDITIRNAHVDATGSSKEAPDYLSTSISGAAIGTSDGSMGNILIENSIIVAEGGYYESFSHAAAIGIGYVGSTMGDIILKDSQITATNNGDGLASVIGAGGYVFVSGVVGALGDIIITNTDLNLSVVISTMNLYPPIIGPGIGKSGQQFNMGKIVFTDMTQAELDEMIAKWNFPEDFNEWSDYVLGRGIDGIAYGTQTFDGVFVSDGADGLVRIDDGNGYYNPE